MKLFEYQAKQLFSEAGIPVPNGMVVHSEAEVPEAAETVGIPCVLKAQVLQGGRGKAGLIAVCRTADEVTDEAARLFALPQVHTLLVEELVDIERELYLSVVPDAVSARLQIMASASGGVEIEQLAADAPDQMITEAVDAARGLQGYQARNISYAMGLEHDAAKQVSALIQGLCRVFVRYDAELAEINPVFVTRDRRVAAGDAKMIIDDNTLDRHPEFALQREHFEHETEFEAAREGIPYLQFDGDISLMCAGAGLTTAVFDLIHYQGGTVANYLEFGGPNYRKASKAMELCLRTPSKVILVVTFGTIARADVMAQGIVDAIRELRPDRPVVTCIRGTHEEEAVKILQKAGLAPLFDTEEAVAEAVRIAAQEVKQRVSLLMQIPGCWSRALPEMRAGSGLRIWRPWEPGCAPE